MFIGRDRLEQRQSRWTGGAFGHGRSSTCRYRADSVSVVAYELISRQIIIIATVTNKRDRRTLAFVIAL